MHGHDQSGSACPWYRFCTVIGGENFQGFQDQVMGEGVELPHFERLTFSLSYTQKKPQTLLLEGPR